MLQLLPQQQRLQPVLRQVPRLQPVLMPHAQMLCASVSQAWLWPQWKLEASGPSCCQPWARQCARQEALLALRPASPCGLKRPAEAPVPATIDMQMNVQESDDHSLEVACPLLNACKDNSSECAALQVVLSESHGLGFLQL